MLIYVSTPSTWAALAREVALKVRAVGHRVAYDWTGPISLAEAYELGESDIATVGMAAIEAVRDAEVFLCIITHPQGPSVGAAVELGVAYTLGRTVIFVEVVDLEHGPWEQHPFRLMAWKRVKSVSEALASLEILSGLKGE